MARAAAALLLLALVALSVLPVGRWLRERRGTAPPALVHGRAAISLRGDGPLRAGAGKAQLKLERAGGLYARALVLEAGGVRAAVVALDALLIPGPLEEEVLRAAGLPPQTCLLFAATHTHAGAGGTWNNLLAEVAGNGVYQAELLRAHRDAVVEALREAQGALAAATLTVSQAPWPEGPARPRGPGPVDPLLTALQLRGEGGRPIATLVDYGMHPTVLRKGRAFVSGDWPGEAALRLEAHGGGPALVVQGAGGNATWAREGMPASPQAAAELLGERVAARALAQLDEAQPRAQSGPAAAAATAPSFALGCEVRLVALPPAQVSQKVPRPLRTLASNLLALFAEPFAVATAIELPGLRLQGVPAEVVGDFGLAAHGGSPAALVTLADGYAGYVETRARWERGLGESQTTYHGPALLEEILGAAPRTARAAPGTAPP